MINDENTNLLVRIRGTQLLEGCPSQLKPFIEEWREDVQEITVIYKKEVSLQEHQLTLLGLALVFNLPLNKFTVYQPARMPA